MRFKVALKAYLSREDLPVCEIIFDASSRRADHMFVLADLPLNVHGDLIN